MDLRQIKNLMKEFEDSTIHKLEISDQDFSIRLEKEDFAHKSSLISSTAPQPSPQVVAEPEKEIEEVQHKYIEVKAPLVGTYYQSASPDSEPFVKVGSRVSKGDILFIVEAMKVMNEVTAGIGGTVKRILVGDSTMVEFGQVILEMEE